MERAKILGIDTRGLPLDQIRIKVAQKDEELSIKMNQEKKNNLVTAQGKDLTEDQKAAVYEKAGKLGIDTTGLSIDQITVKIAEKSKQKELQRAEREKQEILNAAKQYNIDITGLSLEQIKVKVHEKMLPELAEQARKAGIDPTGLGYEQLLKLLK